MDKITFTILGLGSRSTSFYLTELNKLYHQKKGGYSTCPFLLLNANFDRINSLLPNTSESLDTIIQYYISEIEKMDIEHILIPNITLHETIDRLAITKKILHPIHLTASKIKNNNWHEVVLFGSLFSMKFDYIRSIFNSNGIKTILPSEEDMLFIDEFRKQVYNETETKELIKNYYLLIEKYTANTPVVLACTELSIFNPLANKNLLDMALVQMEAAVSIIK
jgi:aspartate racemase